MKNNPVLFDMGDQIAAHALLIDWIEAIVTRYFITRSSRRLKHLIEEPDEIGLVILLALDVYGTERRDDFIAHGHQILSAESRAIGDAHSQKDTKVAHEKRTIACEC